MLNTWVLYRSLSHFKKLYCHYRLTVSKRICNFNTAFYKKFFLILSIIISLSSLLYYSNYSNSPAELYADTKETFHIYNQNIDTIRQKINNEKSSGVPVIIGIFNKEIADFYDEYEIFKEYIKKAGISKSDEEQYDKQTQEILFEQKTLKIFEAELIKKQQIEREKQRQLEEERRKVAEKQKQQSQQEQQTQQSQQLQQVQQSVSLSNVENQVLILLNNTRTNHGVNPLNIDGVLTNIARSRSKDMIDRGYFSHYTPDGRNIFNFIQVNGISYRVAGENLAMGSPPSRGSPRNLIDAWMNSEAHRINMLKGAYNKIGIGIIDQNNKRVVTLVFTG